MRRCGYHHGCMGRGCHPHGVNACTSGVLIKKTIFGEMLTRKSLPKGPTYTYYTSSPLGHSRVSERERGRDKKATTNNFSLFRRRQTHPASFLPLSLFRENRFCCVHHYLFRFIRVHTLTKVPSPPPLRFANRHGILTCDKGQKKTLSTSAFSVHFPLTQSETSIHFGSLLRCHPSDSPGRKSLFPSASLLHEGGGARLLVACSDLAFWRGREGGCGCHKSWRGGEGGLARPKVAKTAERDRTGEREHISSALICRGGMGGPAQWKARVKGAAFSKSPKCE